MSPVAAALAAGLHVATALALLWVSPLNRHDVDVDNAIDVTIEPPTPSEPTPPPVQEATKSQPPPQPTPPPQPPAAQPAPPPPPPPVAAQKLQPQPQPQRNPASKEQLGLPPQGPVEPDKKPEAKLEPKPEPPAEQKPEPQEAAVQPAEPTPPREPEKPLEKVLPPVEQPAAPLTMRDFVKALPPPPAPPPPSPPARSPPPPQHHPQQPQPSPLAQKPPPKEQQEASVSSFQNPAAAYNHARVHDDYLVSIARKMSQYRFVPQSMKGLSSQGVVVLSLVVARDGRLLNSAIAKSSGNRPMDLAVLETAQKAAPYGPLPSEISGSSATFMLSVPYRFVAEQ